MISIIIVTEQRYILYSPIPSYSIFTPKRNTFARFDNACNSSLSVLCGIVVRLCGACSVSYKSTMKEQSAQREVDCYSSM